MAVVTALRERRRAPNRAGMVEVQLDGSPWRLLPADAVVRAGLAVGRQLDRETARTLGRELRRSTALGDAVRTLRHRDLSRSRLDERLARRGVRPAARADALATLERAGLVDDARVAADRARSLADRGYGDAAIRFSLEGEQVAPELVAEALGALEPERERARRLLSDAADVKALRRLAARGFAAETLEDVAGFANGD
jgi:SOS response regulatory protein OraA/RecX